MHHTFLKVRHPGTSFPILTSAFNLWPDHAERCSQGAAGHRPGANRP